MIKVEMMDTDKGYSLAVSGHADYAPEGQDIVCAAVSVLVQTLANKVDAAARSGRLLASCVQHGETFVVQALPKPGPNNLMVASWFDFVEEGLRALAEAYPDNVELMVTDGGADDMDEPAMKLQMFAEGGDGAAAAGGDGAAPAAEEEAASAPAQGKGREAAAAEVDEMLSPAEEPGAEENAAEGEEQDGAADKSGTDPEAHRKAFGELMRGEYNREFGEMIVQATQKAYDSILNEQGPVGRILNALGQKYGTAPGDYEALAAAVEGGVVKDDAYYEDMAMKKGISVQLAKEMDALESENAKHRAAEQQRAEAAKMEAIQQEWDAAVERIRAEDPDFDVKAALADPDFAQMLKLGVKMEDAYKARYFDDIMARKTAETAKKTESGVVERIRQRGARPSENGTNPGGAAVLKTDVSKLTPAQCEELERRAMRGQIITF
ncbi:MAG: ribosomal-processing cysteine protease Prp [Faecalibacterium prausnitzii]|uniref:Ribosomal processing cysteine protease Prp n=1 Tax=Faecalibacterium prausnitzii TaxID=853 RepID=A0A9E1GL96_9FIRM|nr:ribosomal-processing cysteine protease Prp [Faecalibacterium prausnitzii]